MSSDTESSLFVSTDDGADSANFSDDEMNLDGTPAGSSSSSEKGSRSEDELRRARLAILEGEYNPHTRTVLLQLEKEKQKLQEDLRRAQKENASLRKISLKKNNIGKERASS